MSYNAMPIAMGCHCGTIGGLGVTFNQYSAGALTVLDKSKELKGLKITYKNTYQEECILPEEWKKACAAITEVDWSINQDEAFEDVVKTAEDIPVYFLSDVVNVGANARPAEAYGSITPKTLRVADFANWLADKKIGYLMGSPIIQNPLHRIKAGQLASKAPPNYSLNRIWVWVHPKHLPRTLKDSSFETGAENLVDWTDWYVQVGKDLAIKDPTMDKVADYVFKDHKVPQPSRFASSL